MRGSRFSSRHYFSAWTVVIRRWTTSSRRWSSRTTRRRRTASAVSCWRRRSSASATSTSSRSCYSRTVPSRQTSWRSTLPALSRKGPAVKSSTLPERSSSWRSCASRTRWSWSCGRRRQGESPSAAKNHPRPFSGLLRLCAPSYTSDLNREITLKPSELTTQNLSSSFKIIVLRWSQCLIRQ